MLIQLESILFLKKTKKAFDLCVSAELKLDSTFPANQFFIYSCKVLRHVRNRNRGGLMLDIKENIACRYL